MDIAAQIADHFDLGPGASLDGPVARGHQGEIWKLTTERGAWAVKRGFATLHEHVVDESARFQEAAVEAGVRTPRIRRGRHGTVLATLPLGQVRVDAWVDLRAADDAIDARAVGAAIARVHLIPFGTASAPDPWYHDPVGAERWAELARDVASVGAPFARQLGDALEDWVELESCVRPPRSMRMCHRDLWADNVRADADGDVWIIDWHDSGPADPCGELAAALFEYCNTDRERAAALYGGYLSAGGPARVTQVEHFSMAIAQLGHILEVSCRRWLAAAASAEVRTANEARIAEFLGKPLDRRLIERLLDDVRT
jgi:Ser/Thr protein kinase RdoA (MazF antagonist)